MFIIILLLHCPWGIAHSLKPQGRLSLQNYIQRKFFPSSLPTLKPIIGKRSTESASRVHYSWPLIAVSDRKRMRKKRVLCYYPWNERCLITIRIKTSRVRAFISAVLLLMVVEREIDNMLCQELNPGRP